MIYGIGIDVLKAERVQRVFEKYGGRFVDHLLLPEERAQLCVADAPGAVYGQSLTDLEADRFVDARSLRDAKRVLRAALEMCLDGRELKSREVMRAMRRREADARHLEAPPSEQP